MAILSAGNFVICNTGEKFCMGYGVEAVSLAGMLEVCGCVNRHTGLDLD